MPSASEASFGSLSAMPSRAAASPRTRGPPRLEQQPDGRGVDRLRERLLHGDLAQIPPLEIGRAPVADPDRCVQHGVVRADALFQRRKPGERLERRTGLATRQHGAVERSFAVVAAADHGADGAGGGVQRHDRALGAPAAAPGRPAARPGGLRRSPAGADRAWCAAWRRHRPAAATAPDRRPSRRTSRPRSADGREGDLRRGGLRLGRRDSAGVAIAASTSRARAAAAAGSARGLKREGARGRPASTAACHNVTRRAETPKYIRAAASTPQAPEPR